MDGNRFDDLSRSLATGLTRRAALKGAAGALLAAFGVRAGAGAQASQVTCGNVACASNPGTCKAGCVCCVYTNTVTGQVTNSRCRPPGTCSPGVATCPPERPVLDPAAGCVTTTTTTTARPTTTTTAAPPTTTTTPPPTTTTTTTTAATTAPPTCLGLTEVCTGTEQCCQDGGATTCALVQIEDSQRCCRPAGGPCDPAGFGQCCGFIFAGGSSGIACSAQGVCGGAGAPCNGDHLCASGVCCITASGPVCCDVGQVCDQLNAVCVAPTTTTTTTPPPGQGICQAGEDYCRTGQLRLCNRAGASVLCACSTTTGGRTVCRGDGIPGTCAVDADCDALTGTTGQYVCISGGEFCVNGEDVKSCVPLCSDPA